MPANEKAPSPELAPGASAIHSLGHGKAVAWNHAGQICWSAGQFAGCEPTNLPRGIEAFLSDPDQVGAGLPARVSGVAVDGVVKVIATRDDGSTLAVSPSANWYEIELPDGASPWSVPKVEAVFADGTSITTITGAKAPAILSR
jgi:hypothetical protein